MAVQRAPRAMLAILACAGLLVLASASPAFAATSSATPGVSLGTGAFPAFSAGPTVDSKTISAVAYPDWINVTSSAPGASPPPAAAGTMAYDPADNLTLYFGGCTATVCPANETWAFANGAWANLTNPHHAPPARYYASMDYDPNMGGVLLFGGVGRSAWLGDTWLFRHGVWTNLSWVGPGPAARYGAQMAFDPQPEENGSVLFGGEVQGVGVSNDTWIWEGWSGWVPLVTSLVPPATAFGGMAFDVADGAMVLYRGDVANQTWELYSGQWWTVNPTGSVPYDCLIPSTLYDPSLASVVLFGGLCYSGLARDTYAFSGNAWQLLYPAHAPPLMGAAAIGLDPSGSVPVLFGGENFTQDFGSTWVFEAPPSASLAVTASSPEVSAPVTFTASVTGGTPPYTATFDFGDNSTATVTSMASPLTATHAYLHAGSFTPSVAVRDSVGAKTAASSPALTIASGVAVTAAAHPSVADVGFAFAFSAPGVSGGVAPFTYAWSFGDGATATARNATHAYASPGAFTARVTVTDSVGGSASATVSVTVNALPTASIVASNTSASTGVPVGFSAGLAGGTAPFRYAWAFGDGSTSTSAAPSHAFNGTGSFTVQVWVNDTYGGTSHATLTVTVASVTTSGGTEVPLWFWGALAALVAVGALAAALLVLGRRKPKPPATP